MSARWAEQKGGPIQKQAARNSIQPLPLYIRFTRNTSICSPKPVFLVGLLRSKSMKIVPLWIKHKCCGQVPNIFSANFTFRLGRYNVMHMDMKH